MLKDGKTSIELGSLTASHIKQSDLRFIFQIDINESESNQEIRGPLAIGHEAFIHADKMASEIFSTLSKSSDPASLAKALNEIGKAHSKNSGEKDHKEYLKGKISKMNSFVKDLFKIFDKKTDKVNKEVKSHDESQK